MAAPPPQAANAVEDARIRSLIEAVEGVSINRVTKQYFRSAIEEFRRVKKELESEKAEKEAQVQKVIELENEKAQEEALVQDLMAENEELHAMLDKKEAENVELHTMLDKKEAQVEKLMAEIVTLQTMLDKKEAQLLAMSEQCKLMALNHHN